jgi:hypothetical protein
MLHDVLLRPARQCDCQLQNERSIDGSNDLFFRTSGETRQFVLLTKANLLLSGDQEGTLIVPCPPYT